MGPPGNPEGRTLWCECGRPTKILLIDVSTTTQDKRYCPGCRPDYCLVHQGGNLVVAMPEGFGKWFESNRGSSDHTESYPFEERIRDLAASHHCKRRNGTLRAWFPTRKNAEAFAADPANPNYHGDLAHLCAKCNWYHLSRPEWLEPELTHKDAALLGSMGIVVPEKMPGDLTCARCHVPFRVGIDFLILSDGRMVCEDCIG